MMKSEMSGGKTVMVGGAAMFPSKNIIQNAVNSKDHTTLVAAVKAAGLVDTLEGKGPFTVFAPTNAAFGKLPAGTVENLVKPENKATLTKILTYHVVPGKLEASDLTDGKKLKTVEGEELTVRKSGDKVMIIDAKGGSSTVTIPNVNQSNGVIHVVDTVLMPLVTRALSCLSPAGTREREPGQPGSLFRDRDSTGDIDQIARIAVTNRRCLAYNRVRTSRRGTARESRCRALQPATNAPYRPPVTKVIQPGMGPGHALDQCRCDDPDDHVGLADLQCLAAVRFQAFPTASRSAAGSAARCSGISRRCGC